MIRLIFLFLAIAVLSCTTSAQILEPVRWTFEISKKDAKAGDIVELIAKADIDQNWYVYSNDFDPDCGPMLTELNFSGAKNYELSGKTLAIDPIDKHDEAFDCDVRVFKKHGEFRQKIKLLGGPVIITGSITGQVCTEVDGKCVPFEKEFTIDDIKVTGTPTGKATVTPNTDQSQKQNNDSKQISSITPADTAKNKSVTTTVLPTFQADNNGPILDKSILEGQADDNENSSLLGYILFAFVLGLTSLITPCVFPMIPMTVTFFLKENQTKREGIRKAIIFGISIIVIYTVAGTLFAVLLGADGLNALATHWIPNLFIAIIFVVFALSFLGLFEINAPYKLVNKTDQAAEKGGLIGIFFMSATLVLVSFSCTIPLVSNVLVMSAGGKIIKPVSGMLAYSFAFALPFTLFAFFPEWLKGLPKSGGWLNAVKVTLGLFELALALKFFSIADLSYQWGILDRDLNIAIWIVIFSVLGFYLLGKVRFPNDSPTDKIGVPRLLFAIATFSFIVYLIPGLWGAPLKALSGYLPPMYTHDFNLVERLERLEKTSSTEGVACGEAKYGDIFHLPHGLEGYFDYDQALACARAQNKPLFIDFTGHGCANCREMEANVWVDPQVLNRLREDFVIVALYVDDKTELPESEWFTSKVDGKVKKTIGKKNADLQIANLENNAQPFYVIVGQDERVLAWPKAYDKSVENFIDFLESGKKTYNKLYNQNPANL